MKDYTAATYGDRISEIYDRMVTGTGPVETLARLAGGGRALELGIGTGRVALPLAARGVEVHGIDSSEAMVARLRAKPGGDAIPVTIGDFADFSRRRHVRAGLRGVQYLLHAHHPGAAGAMSRPCGRASQRRRRCF